MGQLWIPTTPIFFLAKSPILPLHLFSEIRGGFLQIPLSPISFEFNFLPCLRPNYSIPLIHAKPILKLIRHSNSSFNWPYLIYASFHSSVSLPYVSINSPCRSIYTSISLSDVLYFVRNRRETHRILHRRNHPYLLMAKLIYTESANPPQRLLSQSAFVHNSFP